MSRLTAFEQSVNTKILQEKKSISVAARELNCNSDRIKQALKNIKRKRSYETRKGLS